MSTLTVQRPASKSFARRKANIAECRRLLLALTAAHNEWVGFFLTIEPGESDWIRLRDGSRDIAAKAESIRSIAADCLTEVCDTVSCSPLELLRIGTPNAADVTKKRLRVMQSLARAGLCGEAVSEVAMNRLAWSPSAASVEAVSCRDEVHSVYVACRNGLLSAYELLDLPVKSVGVDMLTAADAHKKELGEITRRLREKYSQSEVSRILRRDYLVLLDKVNPGECKKNNAYPSRATIGRFAEY